MAPLLSRAKSERKYDTRRDNVHRGTTIPFHLVTLRQRFAFTRQGQQSAAVVGFGGGPSEGCDATCSILERPATGLSDPDAADRLASLKVVAVCCCKSGTDEAY
jgi:hypothetical protein